MLPTVIVIGAAKCGTTSVHEYLDDHPEVAMSAEKELNFFVEEKNWPRGIAYDPTSKSLLVADYGESVLLRIR